MGQKATLLGKLSLHAKGKRRFLDLVCIVDLSRSMGGKKLHLMKAALLKIIETLRPEDRLSIISFHRQSERHCDLIEVSLRNSFFLKEIVSELSLGHETNVLSGVSFAVETLKMRRVKNEKSSLLLLSDGEDPNLAEAINRLHSES